MNKLHIINYNIWFEDILEKERLNALINLVLHKDPDIVCLQEVKPHIYDILKSHFDDYDYYPKKIYANYGSVIFSKYAITKCLCYPFNNSVMGRNIVVAKIDFPFVNQDLSIEKIELVITNTHFESMFSAKTENTIKLEQYKTALTVLDNLYDKYKNVIFCTDTNIIDNEESKFIPTNDMFTVSNWYDAWKEMGNNSNKFTYDSFNNIYLKSKNCKYKSRLDRLLFRCDNCNIQSFDLTKNGYVEISDHFGLSVKFEINT